MSVDCPLLVDCPESMLGTLGNDDVKPSKDGVEVHGIFLPHNVAHQLQQQGRPLASYSRGELYDAIWACVADGNLIDDPNGTTFEDQLTLTPQEIRERAHAHGNHTFCDRLEEEVSDGSTHAHS